MQEQIITRINRLIRMIRKGRVLPSETNIGYCLNKLKEINPSLQKDYLNTYKLVLKEIKSK